MSDQRNFLMDRIMAAESGIYGHIKLLQAALLEGDQVGFERNFRLAHDCLTKLIALSNINAGIAMPQSNKENESA